MEMAKDFAGAKSSGIDLAPIHKALMLAEQAADWDGVQARLSPTLREVALKSVVLEVDGKEIGRHITKAGRRLSSKTEQSLRSAHKSATEAVEHLSAVLEVAEEQMDEDDKSTPTEPVLFVTPSPANSAPVYAVNPDDVKAAVVAAVSATVQAEVNRLRGRLD
jgi:hypothetical protein